MKFYLSFKNCDLKESWIDLKRIASLSLIDEAQRINPAVKAANTINNCSLRVRRLEISEKQARHLNQFSERALFEKTDTEMISLDEDDISEIAHSMPISVKGDVGDTFEFMVTFDEDLLVAFLLQNYRVLSELDVDPEE